MRKKEKVKLFKHQVLITAISVFAVVCSMIGGSYAIFSSTSKADEYNVLKVGDLEISYVDTGDGYGDILSLNGAYPMSDPKSDKEWDNIPSYRFSIMNTGSIDLDFKIKILNDESIIEEDDCKDNLLPQQYIKYRLDNGTSTLLSSKEADGYTIYDSKSGNGPLTSGSTEIHNVYLWIDESAPNSVIGKHFHGKVVIESIQSGVDGEIKEYSIGQSVTLKDGSKWHVLENSNSQSATITLLSDYNLSSDGSYDIGCNKESNSTTICSPQVFDIESRRLTENNSYCLTPENGCNMYGQNGSSVIYDSTIKEWLQQTYLPRLQESITSVSGTLEDLTVSLPTMEQLARVNNQVFDQKLTTFYSSWLTTTSYWTKTPSNLNTSYVWGVSGEYNNSSVQNANDGTKFGVRPVIVISKQNIQ